MTGRPDYESRQAARQERLYQRAEKRAAEGAAKLSAAHRTLDMIPMGQPILVGHHSEKRHRRDIARTHSQLTAGFAAQKEAGELVRRADAVGTAGISADDPEAVTKLRAELAGHEKNRERMKSANAAWKKATTPEERDAVVTKHGINAAHLRATLKMGHAVPYPPWALSNLGANIRRITKRIAELSKPTPTFDTITGEGWSIEARPDLNRITLTCAARLPRETFLALKRDGWRWSPTEGAFLVGLHNRGIYAAQCAAKLLGAPAPVVPAKVTPGCACERGSTCDVSHDPATCPCAQCSAPMENA